MNSFVYEFIIYAFEALISYVFLLNILETKYGKRNTVVMGLEVAIVLLFSIPSFTITKIVVGIVVELVMVFLLFEGNVKKKLFVFVFKEIIVALSSMMAFVFVLTFVNRDIQFSTTCSSGDCTYCLLYILMYSVLTSLVLQFYKNVRPKEFSWVLGTMVLLSCAEVMSVLSVALYSNMQIRYETEILIVAATPCFIVANLSVGMLAPYLLKKIRYSADMDYGKELSNMEYKYYEMSVENEKNLNFLKHDISNHIQTIYSLIENGQNQKGLELIDEIKTRYSFVDNIVYCNNSVVNIILANKQAEADKKGIETQITIKDELDNLPVSDYDLSTVICNLLDNAIEGCIYSNQPRPKLVVEMLYKNQHLVINVENTCKYSMNIEKTDKVETTKYNSSKHGFGLPIVRGIAEKYSGDFMVSAQDGLFKATFVLPIKK